LLYFLRDNQKQDASFIEKEMKNICASYQRTVVSYLLSQLEKAAKEHNIKDVCLAGGVSANSELRLRFKEMCERNDWRAFIPAFEYCTDNAAMIGITAHFKYEAKDFGELTDVPQTSWSIE
jgi:N6-L-threonylcarbamoyladenine synthase